MEAGGRVRIIHNTNRGGEEIEISSPAALNLQIKRSRSKIAKEMLTIKARL